MGDELRRMICTDLFKDCKVATAQVEGDIVAVCIIRSGDWESPSTTFEMHIDKLMNFLDQCRRQQSKMSR